MKNIIKKIKNVKKTIPISEYISDFVDTEAFFEACRESCPNYGRLWCCPPYTFDTLEYWQQFDFLDLIASRILFTEEAISKTYGQDELTSILSNISNEEKTKLTETLYSLEDENSISLSAGSCSLCDSCTRPDGLPCRHPDKMRYSIESLGGNVGLTCTRLLHETPEWLEEGKLPSSLIIVCGLLRKTR